MKLATLVALGVSCLASVCQAGFVTSGTQSASGRSVQYAVWKNDGSSLGLAISSSLNDFVYLYQVLSPSTPPTNDFTIIAGTPSFTMGVVNGSVFSGATTFAAGATQTSTVGGSVGTLASFNISPFVGSGPSSGIMYLVSTFGPGLGSLTLGTPPSLGGTVTFIGPVPAVPESAEAVPLPPALLLMAIGMPLVGLIRRRKSAMAGR
jgi:hypothetical protein